VGPHSNPNITHDKHAQRWSPCITAWAWFSLVASFWPGVFAQSLASAGEATRRLRPDAKQPSLEYLVNPWGIDEIIRAWSWVVESSQRGQRQQAYQNPCRRATKRGWSGSRRPLGTGKVASGETTGIAYAGKTLRSQQQCFWKLKVWDKERNASAWSTPESWSMGC